MLSQGRNHGPRHTHRLLSDQREQTRTPDEIRVRPETKIADPELIKIYASAGMIRKTLLEETACVPRNHNSVCWLEIAKQVSTEHDPQKLLN